MSKTKQYKQKVVIVGCGNVAWHLCKHLSALKKFEISVYNHGPNNALAQFKKQFLCKTHATLNKVENNADYYIIAVSDSNIASVEIRVDLKKPDALIMHTSGSVELAALGNRAHASAVMYPLQTFTKSDELNWKEIPIIIEADNEATRRQTAAFAAIFSNNIIFADYQTRLKIHLAAVLVNNFTNALYTAALTILNNTNNKEQFKIDTLLPLIRQTVNKLKLMPPVQAQTGPAKRGDEVVLEKHLHLLKGNKELKKVYKQLSKLIVAQQGKKHA